MTTRNGTPTLNGHAHRSPNGTAPRSRPATPAEDQPAVRGFFLLCPHCRNASGVAVDLHDLASLYCTECEQEITPEDVRLFMLNLEEILDGWTALLAWCRTAPQVSED